MTHNILRSPEAHWPIAERLFVRSVQLYPPRKARSSWPLVLIGLVLVIIAVGGLTP